VVHTEAADAFVANRAAAKIRNLQSLMRSPVSGVRPSRSMKTEGYLPDF
jgi:hypothetical protein